MAILPAGLVGVSAQRPGAARKASSGFSVPENGHAHATAPLLAAGLDGFLSLQEVETATDRNHRARQHGQSLLDTLGRLQRTLLGDGDEAALLGQLTELSRDHPVADDASLRDVMQAISVRVHVELARRAIAEAAG